MVQKMRVKSQVKTKPSTRQTGKVMSQVFTILLLRLQLTAVRRLLAPTPMIAVPIV